jgi:hypothetical protein
MLGLSPHNVVGVGDAENDHTLLQVCEAGVAVQNALETLREGADLVTAAPHGRGVTELIDSLLRDDLADLAPARHAVEIGEGGGGVRVGLPPSGASVLIAGTSGGGKSTLAASILERLTAQRYQYCLIDPEGDHAAQENAVILGSPRGAPEIAEVMTALAKPEQNCVVNLVGISIGERPPYFEKLLLGLLDLRHRTGRPHWLILDEAHHVLPGARGEAADASSPPMPGVLMITVEPEEIAGPALAGVDFILAIGDPARVLASFGRAAGEPAPAISARRLEQGEAMIWRCHPPGEPCVFRAFPPTRTRRRHSRKYAEGDVRDSSFFFRGPEGKLNLRAQNLMVFLQIAEGLDAETWDFHLRRGDYEKWFRDIIKDPELADFAASQAVTNGDSGGRSREAIREKIRERYTAPA